MREFDFTGQKVLVVGGSSGIGNGIAQAFSHRGAEVHVWGTRPSADDYVGVEGSDLQGLAYMQVDVSLPDAITAAAAAFDRLDVLILSQGTVLYRRQEFEPEGWSKVMAINLDSVMRCTQSFHGALKSAGGRVVVVNSVGAFRATMGTPAYSASKAGLVGLVRSLAQAWAGDGIRVNAFAPSLVDTKMTKVTMENPERRERSLSRIPSGRFGTVEEMAGVAMFLASPLSGYIFGQTIVVDGGLTL